MQGIGSTRSHKVWVVYCDLDGAQHVSNNSWSSNTALQGIQEAQVARKKPRRKSPTDADVQRAIEPFVAEHKYKTACKIWYVNDSHVPSVYNKHWVDCPQLLTIKVLLEAPRCSGMLVETAQ